MGMGIEIQPPLQPWREGLKAKPIWSWNLPKSGKIFGVIH